MQFKWKKKKQLESVRAQALKEADKMLVKALAPGKKKKKKNNQMNMQDLFGMFNGSGEMPNFNQEDDENQEEVDDTTRNKRLSLKEKLDQGLLEHDNVTIKLDEQKKVNPMNDMMGQMGMDMSDMMSSLRPQKKIKRTLQVKEARELLIQEQAKKISRL